MMSRWVVGLGCVLVLACGSGETSAPAPATTGAIGSCNMTSASTCIEYGDGTPEVRVLARSACSAEHGHFAEAACPSTDVVATCAASAGGDVTRYYATGGTPFTAESGQAACTAAAAPVHSTTTMHAPPPDAVTLQAWCDGSSAWRCTHCQPTEDHDACVIAASASCLGVAYAGTTLLARDRAALDRCLADQEAAGCGVVPSSCRPPPVAPGTSLQYAAWCQEIARVRCDRCEHEAWAADSNACETAHCPASRPMFGTALDETPAGTLEDLEHCLETARTAACDAPAPTNCGAGWTAVEAHEPSLETGGLRGS